MSVFVPVLCGLLWVVAAPSSTSATPSARAMLTTKVYKLAHRQAGSVAGRAGRRRFGAELRRDLVCERTEHLGEGQVRFLLHDDGAERESIAVGAGPS